MTNPSIAWVLNLDAEEEYARGRGYTPKQRIHKIARQQARALTGSLIQPEDLIIDARNTNKGVAKGMRGLAWSPTPWAQNQLHEANARVPQPPVFQILQEVNSKLFSQAVETSSPRLKKHLERSVDGILHTLGNSPDRTWFLRRPYGVAGRGRLLMQGEPQSNKELRWLIASIEIAPMVMEPQVHVILEVSTCGWITRQGEVTLAAPCFQEVDKHGSWLRTLPCPEGKLTDLEREHLQTAALDAAGALVDAGYWGPFSVDAFEYESGDGEESWNTLGEINARFTMGWATAFGESAREWLLA
ncbi:MAG: hypothetical protein P1V35_11295 [Planctomycetota bacterium]|nr:hypothetical protein [Planctomycetota bacterium]